MPVLTFAELTHHDNPLHHDFSALRYHSLCGIGSCTAFHTKGYHCILQRRAWILRQSRLVIHPERTNTLSYTDNLLLRLECPWHVCKWHDICTEIILYSRVQTCIGGIRV